MISPTPVKLFFYTILKQGHVQGSGPQNWVSCCTLEPMKFDWAFSCISGVSTRKTRMRRSGKLQVPSSIRLRITTHASSLYVDSKQVQSIAKSIFQWTHHSTNTESGLKDSWCGEPLTFGERQTKFVWGVGYGQVAVSTSGNATRKNVAKSTQRTVPLISALFGSLSFHVVFLRFEGKCQCKIQKRRHGL